MSLSVGSSIPEGTFLHITPSSTSLLEPGSPAPFSTSSLTSKVVLVGSVGAFAPADNGYVADYIKNASAFQAKGVSTIAVVATNDVFVLCAWAKSLGSHSSSVLFLSDPVAKWLSSVGLTTDLSSKGLGVRASRFVAVIEGGKITSIEVEASPEKVTVTAADAVLGKL